MRTFFLFNYLVYILKDKHLSKFSVLVCQPFCSFICRQVKSRDLYITFVWGRLKATASSHYALAVYTTQIDALDHSRFYLLVSGFKVTVYLHRPMCKYERWHVLTL